MSAEQMTLVEDCEARDSALTEWDRGFLDSIRRQLEGGRTLTQKQVDTLDEIWERATARG